MVRLAVKHGGVRGTPGVVNAGSSHCGSTTTSGGLLKNGRLGLSKSEEQLTPRSRFVTVRRRPLNRPEVNAKRTGNGGKSAAGPAKRQPISFRTGQAPKPKGSQPTRATSSQSLEGGGKKARRQEAATRGGRRQLPAATATNRTRSEETVRRPRPTLVVDTSGEGSEPDVYLTPPAGPAVPDLAALQVQVKELLTQKEEHQELIRNLRMEIERQKDAYIPATPTVTPATPTVDLMKQEDMSRLELENQLLREKLLQFGISVDTSTSLSDQEKELLLQKSKSASAPPSILGNEIRDADVDGEIPGLTESVSPEWDKHSSSSVSEISVANLQDRIMQMEETHYSTNEELQATLQELSDLQTQLLELQVENDQLIEDKNVIYQSLVSQTEKLDESRNQIDDLRALLLQGTENIQSLGESEREQKLVDLLKSVQEEREELLLKNEELSQKLDVYSHRESSRESIDQQREEKVRLLESRLTAAAAEKRHIEEQLSDSREQNAGQHIEISRLQTLLDNSRVKISELQQAREAGDRTELDELIDSLRCEKDGLESHVATLQEHLSRGQNEITKLKEQVSALQEECKVTRNNAKMEKSDLEFQLVKANESQTQYMEQLSILQENIAQLELSVQSHLEDKREMKTIISENQKQNTLLEVKVEDLRKIIEDEKLHRKMESDEWEQFQNDLLLTVKVANDFKTEAQQDLEKMLMENQSLKESVRSLESENRKLKVTQKPLSPQLSERRVLRTVSNPFPPNDNMLSSVHELTSRRRTDNKQLSVKSLIETIEKSNKSVAMSGDAQSTRPVLRRAETDSLFFTHQGAIKDKSSTMSQSLRQPLHQRNSYSEGLYSRSNLSDSVKSSSAGKTEADGKPAPVSILTNKYDHYKRNSYGEPDKDPLYALVKKNGGSKRNSLLKWCQSKVIGYKDVDITNFSSSWNDGMSFCALLHTYIPDKIPYESLTPSDKRTNFNTAFHAAESVGITTTLNVNELVSVERPDWQSIMSYVTSIYKHFET